jgi:hypothetical protein
MTLSSSVCCRTEPATGNFIGRTRSTRQRQGVGCQPLPGINQRAKIAGHSDAVHAVAGRIYWTSEECVVVKFIATPLEKTCHGVDLVLTAGFKHGCNFGRVDLQGLLLEARPGCHGRSR